MTTNGLDIKTLENWYSVKPHVRSVGQSIPQPRKSIPDLVLKTYLSKEMNGQQKRGDLRVCIISGVL